MSAEFFAAGARRYGSIGKYEVLEHLATGGMCAVYRALDVERGLEVALKILSPEMAARPVLLERFRREARHVARLRHKNIVAIHECGEASGTYYLALEFVNGTDLHEYVLKQGQLRLGESCRILKQAARALNHLHQHGIVHRDVKPGNILLTLRHGKLLVKLTDLGLARLTLEEEFRVTRTGHTVGTLDYMAPEQARDSSRADIRSDLYALGCTWYYMLAGRPPFGEGSLGERLYQHLHVQPPDICTFNSRVKPELASLLQKLLAKNPNERCQTPAELLQVLSRLRHSYSLWDLPSGAEGTGESASTTRCQPDVREPVCSPRTTPGGDEHDTRAESESEGLDAGLAKPNSEYHQVAIGQFQRAKEVIAVGNFEYGIHLLLACCRLEPGNLAYRRYLRAATRAQTSRSPSGGWRGLLKSATTKSRLSAAKAARDYQIVLDYGEAILVQHPWDVRTQREMAEAAEALGLIDVAAWILETACQQDSPDPGAARALAELQERHGNIDRAIVLWERVHRVDPNDPEAARKSRDLAATKTIGQYQAAVKRAK